MKSYVALRLHDMEKLKNATIRGCFRYGGLDCWMAIQLIHWKNTGLTIEKKEKTLPNFSMEELKRKVAAKPLQENIIIDQQDIEELDFKTMH